MLTPKDLQLFESIARGNPRFKEWLENELDKRYDVLVNMSDPDLLRRAQGYAQCLQVLIGHLDSAINPVRERGR